MSLRSEKLPYDLIEALVTRVPYAQRLRVRQKVMGREVEFRVLPKAAPPPLSRAFLQEWKELTRLDHSAFLPVLEMGGVQGRHCYSVPYRDHPTLHDLGTESGLTSTDKAMVLRCLGSGLAAMHDTGIFKGPMDPRFIAFDSRRGQAYHLHHLAGSKETFGRIWNLLPEDARQATQASASRDLFFWGLLGFFLFTQEPWTGSEADVRTALDRVQPALPATLRIALEACLTLDPKDRPSDALELEEVLLSEGWEPELGSAKPASRVFQEHLDRVAGAGTEVLRSLPYALEKEVPSSKPDLEEFQDVLAMDVDANLEESPGEPAPVDFGGVSRDPEASQVGFALSPTEPGRPSVWSGLLAAFGAGCLVGVGAGWLPHGAPPSARSEARPLPSRVLEAPPKRPREDRASKPSKAAWEELREASITPENFLSRWRRLRDLSLQGELPEGSNDKLKILKLRSLYFRDPQAGARGLEAFLRALP